MDKNNLSEKAVDALSAERRPPVRTSTAFVCLNFKVPLRVRRQFKVYAARHNLTMTELLLQLLDDCFTSDVTVDAYSGEDDRLFRPNMTGDSGECAL